MKKSKEQLELELETARFQNSLLKSALAVYADYEYYHKGTYLVLGEKAKYDIEETQYSRFTPGRRAREVLRQTGGPVVTLSSGNGGKFGYKEPISI